MQCDVSCGVVLMNSGILELMSGVSCEPNVLLGHFMISQESLVCTSARLSVSFNLSERLQHRALL